MPRSGVTSTTRSRGGCLRCKSRHIKCDESRPECQTCCSNNIKCPGYEKTFKWSNKHERLHSFSKKNTTTGSPRRTSAQPSVPLSSNHGDNETVTVQTTRLDTLSDQTDIPWSGVSDDSLFTDLPVLWPDFEIFGYENMIDLTSNISEIPGTYLSTYAARASLRSNESTLFDPNRYSHHPSEEAHLAIPELSPAENFGNTHQTQSASDCQELSSRSSSSVLRYLQTYYRQTSVGTITGYSDQDLIHHYFKHVCSLFSCFDSSLNPFRDLVSANWSSSATLNLSIQSMSAAHLANYYPSLATVGARKRSQAWISLQRDLSKHRLQKAPTNVLSLSLMLLGLSSSWHQGSSIGIQYIFIARNLLRRQVEEGDDGVAFEFFQKGLMYWEMLLSFVDPIPITALPGRLVIEPPEDISSSPGQILPHPWTGVVTEVHFALAEIGRILRRQRATNDVSAIDHTQSSDDNIPASFDVVFATDLEKFLHTIKIPPIEKIIDLHDKRTSKDDLIRVAMAYRLAGLLEIYSIFPDLAQQRIVNATTVDGFNFGYEAQGSDDHVAKCLTDLAKHILFQIVEPITIRSGSNRMLPLLYVIIASRLQITKAQNDTDMDSGNDDEIQPRTLIEERMLELSRKYPQRPQLQMLDIIREVWNQLDGGRMDVHWLNVIHEKGMQIVMG